MLENHKKKLKYQSWYRGCKETDKVLGGFADYYLKKTNNTEAYEALLKEDDWDIWRWITGTQPVPDEHQALIAEIIEFQRDKVEGTF